MQYMQEGDVGPWCVGQPALAADALRVGVRLARLEPVAAAGAAERRAGQPRAGAGAPGRASPLPSAEAVRGGCGGGGAHGEAAAARFLLEGVSASLLTRGLRQQQAGDASGLAAVGSSDGTGGGAGAAPMCGGFGGPAAAGDRRPGVDSSVGRRAIWDEWDSEYTVLRQWFAQATLFVTSEEQPAVTAERGSPGDAGQQQKRQQQQASPGKLPPAARRGGAAARLAPQPALKLVMFDLGGVAAPKGHLGTAAAAGGAAATRGNNGDGEPGGCLLSVEVGLKSLVLDSSPEAAAVFLRLVNR